MAQQSPRVRRTFTPRFKQDAVALVTEGRSVNAVTHELGIARSLLQRWRTQLRGTPEAACPGVRSLCRVLGVSRSGFDAWVRRPPPRPTERNDALLVHIRAAHAASRRTYGAPRIHRELEAHGVAAGRHRIARLMRREGIVACTERRVRGTATAPDQRWVSDIPSVRTGHGWLHVAIVLDLYARRIVGWAMAPTLDQPLAQEALAMALIDRRPAPGLLFHSDRGSPFLSRRVQQRAQRAGLVLSTSRPGRGGARGDLRVHRRLLQPDPTALEQRLPLPRRPGSRVCAQRHVTRVHHFGATSVGCMQ